MTEAERDEAFERWVREVERGWHRPAFGEDGDATLAKWAWDTAWADRTGEIRRVWEAVKAPPGSTTHAILSLVAGTCRLRVEEAERDRDAMQAQGHTDTADYHQGRADAFRASAYLVEEILGTPVTENKDD